MHVNIRRQSQITAVELPMPKPLPKMEKAICELVESLTENFDLEHEAVEKLSEATEAMIYPLVRT